MRRCVGRWSARVIRTSGAKTIRGTAGDGLEDVREDIAGRVDIVKVISGAGMIAGKDVLELE